jgi:hypothetical protein
VDGRGTFLQSHVVSTRVPTTVGAAWRDPTEVAFSIVSGRFMEVSRLRSAPLDTTSGRAGEADSLQTNDVSTLLDRTCGGRGRRIPQKTRRLDQSPGSRLLSGQSGETPTEVAVPLVSARFMGVSRLRSAPLDTTRGGRGSRIPQKPHRLFGGGARMSSPGCTALPVFSIASRQKIPHPVKKATRPV